MQKLSVYLHVGEGWGGCVRGALDTVYVNIIGICMYEVWRVVGDGGA